MSPEAQIEQLRQSLNEAGAVTFHRKDAVGRWSAAIDALQAEGFATTELVQNDSQSSSLIVRKCAPNDKH